MGNCCQEMPKQSSSEEQILATHRPKSVQKKEQKAEPVKQSEYEEGKWPQDQFLARQLAKTNVVSQQALKKPRKNKTHDRWYCGDWNNGKPYGKGIIYQTGVYGSVYYEGDFDGEPSGTGKVILNKGQCEYTGQIAKSKATGSGTLTNYKDCYQFKGEWRESEPYRGTVVFHDTSQFKRTTPGGNGDIVIKLDPQNQKNEIRYPDGRVYVGAIDKYYFAPHGSGKAIFPTKDVYQGDWEEGEMHGEGKFTWADGSYYQGQYCFGKRHGYGKFSFSSGNYYLGYWLRGKQNGKGTLYNSSKKVLLDGSWKNGEFVDGSKKSI